MSDNLMINNQTEENIYLSVYTSGSSDPAYKTYIPPGGSWGAPSDVISVSVIEQADYDSDTDPITAWAGEYETETHYWGETYSPLVIDEDGTVTVAGQELVVTFDEDTSVLSWDWQEIGDQTTKATITFSEPDGEQQFSGTINPRKQDGPVSYTGTEVSP